MKDGLTIVCALGDAPRMVPGSTFEHRCSKCGRVVMMAPSGQKMLKDNPQAIILCDSCFDPRPGDYFAVPNEEAFAEKKRSVPNMRRHRN